MSDLDAGVQSIPVLQQKFDARGLLKQTKMSLARAFFPAPT